MPVYREGWVDLAPDNMYGADAAAYTIMPTKYTYLLFNWKKRSTCAGNIYVTL